MSQRSADADDGELILTKRRSVCAEGTNGRSLKHTIPGTAVEIIGIDDDSTAVIDIYKNGYFVHFEE